MSAMAESRGLNFEEKLLFETSSEGACGVDLPQPKNTPLRTGQAARESVV